MPVNIYINLKIFVETLADKIAMGVNTRCRRYAKEIVASPWNPNAGYALGDLANSIRTEGINGKYQTIAGGVMQTLHAEIYSFYGRKSENKMIAYALAQEYGKPNYTHRAYMRPAAAKAASGEVVAEVVRESVEAALMRSKIG